MIVAGHDVLYAGGKKFWRKLPGRQQGLGEIDRRVARKNHHLAGRRLRARALRLGQLGLVALLADADEMFRARSLRADEPERVVENLTRNPAAIHPENGF